MVMKKITMFLIFSLVVASCMSQPEMPQQAQIYAPYEELTEINSGKTEVVGKGLFCEFPRMNSSRVFFLVKEGVFSSYFQNGRLMTPQRERLLSDDENYLRFGVDIVSEISGECSGIQTLTFIDRTTLRGSRIIRSFTDVNGQCLNTSTEHWGEMICQVADFPDSINTIIENSRRKKI